MGGDRRLQELVGELASVVMHPAAERSASAMRALTGLRGDQRLRLDELSRRFTYASGDTSLARLTEWPVSTVTDPVVAVAASMSRDGRTRERAVGWLAGMRGPVPAAAVAVRVDDWVPAVAAAATAAVARFDRVEELAVVVPVMLRLLHRRRGVHTALGYLQGVSSVPAETLLALTGQGERAGRVWVLGRCTTRALLTDADLLDRARGDRDPVLALWCAEHLLDGEVSPLLAPGGDRVGVAVQLLGSRRALVRAAALRRISDSALTQAVLEPLLLDGSGAVRTLARWRWTRAWAAPVAVYEQALTAADDGGSVAGSSFVAAALDGLEECSPEAAREYAVPLLAHPSPRVRAVAVRVVGRTVLRDLAPLEVLLPCLRDPSNRVVRAAVRYVRERAGQVPAGFLAELAVAEQSRDRVTALRLRQHLTTWERVRADLNALRDGDLQVVELARTDLLAWLHDDAARAYGGPTPDQAADIAAGLTQPGLTNQQRREIAFVTGLRPEAAVPEAEAPVAHPTERRPRVWGRWIGIWRRRGGL